MRLSSSSSRSPASRSRGVALIIVLLVIFALTVTAAVFSYQMRVETRLATVTQSESDLEWMGRSGVEFAKWVLIEQQRIASERNHHALNQFWAGGPGPLDAIENPFEGVSLSNMDLGEGRISIRIVDEERRFNVNRVQPQQLDLALSLIGADAADASTIGGALQDWIDRDEFPRPGGGAESDYYETLDPPYLAKNGPVDDITELLKIKGVTPALFYGPRWRTTGFGDDAAGAAQLPPEEELLSFGLVDVFTALSSGQININTAPEPVLALALGGDPALAREIVRIRAGPDGVDGTEDDEPARNPGEIGRLLGPGGAAAVSPGTPWTVQSLTFLVQVTAEVGNARRRYVATMRRGGQSPRDFTVLTFRQE